MLRGSNADQVDGLLDDVVRKDALLLERTQLLKNAIVSTLAPASAQLLKDVIVTTLAPSLALAPSLGQSNVTVTLSPIVGSGDPSEGAASHLLHKATFSICDILPPPLMIVCMILEFLLFTWPLYYIWLTLIVLLILLQIYNAFKETLDPIIIMILDAIYLVVWVVVRTLQFIWACFKSVAYPIKQSIIGCIDTVDQHLNPYKKKTPQSHVPGFSY
jgi:hypothetical protein